MRQSKMLIPTRRELSGEVESISSQMLLKGGFIRQVSAGVYSYLPLAWRILEKMKGIIREELSQIEAQEMAMPHLLPQDLWEKSQRLKLYGDVLYQVQDRHDKTQLLGATHEEVFTQLISDEVNSYKRLPLSLFQIQTKFRDEKKTRHGLIKSREFLMLDAYSFHSDEASLTTTYQQFTEVFQRIFTRIGLDFQTVMAGNGLMGGREAKEFIAVSDIGEEVICSSSESDYTASLEVATSLYQRKLVLEATQEMEKVATPQVGNVEEAAEFFNIPLSKVLKARLYFADERPVMILVAADQEINENKVKKVLGVLYLREGTAKEGLSVLGAPFGWIGPVGIPEEVPIYADLQVQEMTNVVCGANEEEYHFLHGAVNRDFKPVGFYDLRYVKEGEPSPDGKGVLKFEKGIEVGHIFKLGTFYSEKLNATVLDETGQYVPVFGGSYGIGLSRLLATLVLQYGDEQGISWPKNIAPFDLHIVQMNMSDEFQTKLTDELEADLSAHGYQILVDDRNERAGVKFTDADLIGCPLRITVGKKAMENIVEVKLKRTGSMLEVRKDELLDTIPILLATAEEA